MEGLNNSETIQFRSEMVLSDGHKKQLRVWIELDTFKILYAMREKMPKPSPSVTEDFGVLVDLSLFGYAEQHFPEILSCVKPVKAPAVEDEDEDEGEVVYVEEEEE